MATKKVSKKALVTKTYPYFEIYPDNAGEWRWVIKARNGQIIADSGEGYETHANVERAVAKLNEVDWPLFVEEADEELVFEPLPEPSSPTLAFTVQPQATKVNQTLPMIQVTALNASRGIITNFNGNVTLSMGSGRDILAGTRTVQAVNGIATFTDLSVVISGKHVLVARAPGFNSVRSIAFEQFLA